MQYISQNNKALWELAALQVGSFMSPMLDSQFWSCRMVKGFDRLRIRMLDLP